MVSEWVKVKVMNLGYFQSWKARNICEVFISRDIIHMHYDAHLLLKPWVN
jgi:hypothetical protein